MAVSPPANKKKYPFDAATKEEWLAAALLEWQGATFADKSVSPESGIVIEPYYDNGDLPLKKISPLPASQHATSGARAWANMPLISMADDLVANRQALASLNSGADGILFELSPNANPERLLKDIHLNYCSVSFISNPINGQFIQGFRKLLIDRNYEPSAVTGAIFHTTGKSAEIQNIDFSDWHGFHANGVCAQNEDESAAELIFKLLMAASEKIENASQQGIDVKRALASIAFLVPAGTDFFLEIAKLKTLRSLWYTIAEAWSPSFNEPLYIHAVSRPWIKETWQPHGNLLKATTAAMSSILGGCNALTICPEDTTSAMMQRVALNISLVLREESHFTKVADPVAGAGFVEHLTDNLSKAVWEKFQRQ